MVNTTERRRDAVHPHIRGAYQPIKFPDGNRLGSSPHTWGIQSMTQREMFEMRFIPTYVGHTMGSLERPAPPSVHPHIRGAYFAFRVSLCSSFGSSPHTWGIHEQELRMIASARFIPTYVGHTHTMQRKKWNTPVHPHIRGAYIGFSFITNAPFGSSPHTWGIPQYLEK